MYKESFRHISSALLITLASFVIVACGGGGGNGSGDGSNKSSGPAVNTLSASGQVIASVEDLERHGGMLTNLLEKRTASYTKYNYASIPSEKQNFIWGWLMRLSPVGAAHAAVPPSGVVVYPESCSGYYPSLWSNLSPNIHSGTTILNKTHTATVESLGDDGEIVFEAVELIAYNIDINGDGIADLNIEIGDDVAFINLDTNCDGKPDINIDSDGDGVADTNIDIDGDGLGDYSIVDGGGVSIAGAEVFLTHADSGEKISSMTGDDGRFEVEGIRTGRYYLEIRHTSESTGRNLWKVATIYIDRSGDTGTHRLDSRPQFFEAKIVDQSGELLYDQSEYGLQLEYLYVSADLQVGNEYTVVLRGKDPNGDTITLATSEYDWPPPCLNERDNYCEGQAVSPWVHRIVSDGRVIDERTGMQELEFGLRLHNDRFEYVGLGLKRMPRIPYIIDSIECEFYLDDCMEKQRDIEWAAVEFVGQYLTFNNQDGHGEYNGIDDGVVNVRLYNSTYDRTIFDKSNPAPVINSITVNGVMYENQYDGPWFHADIGDISEVDELHIQVDLTADEAYPVLVTANYPRVDYDLPTEEGVELYIDVTNIGKAHSYQYLSIAAQYAERKSDGSWERYSSGVAEARLFYSIHGDAEPAHCAGISIDGSNGDNSGTIFYVGQTITISPIYSDPKGLPGEYYLTKLGNHSVSDGSITDGWISVAEMITYTFSPEDNISNLSFRLMCRNNDGIGWRWPDGADSTVDEPIKVMAP